MATTNVARSLSQRAAAPVTVTLTQGEWDTMRTALLCYKNQGGNRFQAKKILKLYSALMIQTC
jgi:hypothetical protein